jgi:hypothetical protein
VRVVRQREMPRRARRERTPKESQRLDVMQTQLMAEPIAD